MFANREEAGRLLGPRLEKFRDKDPCVLALPRGGVPAGLEIAKQLGAPLDLIIVRKLGAPAHPELAIGAIVDGENPQTVLNDGLIAELSVPASYIEDEKRRQLAEIKRRELVYLAGRPRVGVAGKTAIITDDGIATGATIKAAILAIRALTPKCLVLAAPVAPTDTFEALKHIADEVVCLETHDFFPAIGCYYRDFHQIEDEEMLTMMRQAPLTAPAKKTTPRPR